MGLMRKQQCRCEHVHNSITFHDAQHIAADPILYNTLSTLLYIRLQTRRVCKPGLSL